MGRASTFLAFIFVYIFCIFHVLAWDPDAGLIPNYAHIPGSSLWASSTDSSSSIILGADNDPNTCWESQNCYPGNFAARADLNLALGACAHGLCTSSSSNSGGIAAVTDGDLTTAFTAQPSNNEAWVMLPIANPGPILLVALKVGSISSNINIFAIASDSSNVTVGALNQSEGYSYVTFQVKSTKAIKYLQVTSTQGIQVFELSYLIQPCFERFVVDAGKPVTIGSVSSRHTQWGSGITIYLETSNDNVTWNTVGQLNPSAPMMVDTAITPPVTARYVSLKLVPPLLVDWTKIVVYELEPYDQYGRYGPPPAPVPQTKSMAALIGVNGIWGWGTNTFSNQIPGNTSGPRLYDQVASNARNYHDWDWDVTSPNIIPWYNPNYSNGTQSKSWLNWFAEYGAWNAADLPPEASIQFTTSDFPMSSFKNPYTDGYNYGYVYAKSFGPTYGGGVVKIGEVGNEPWDYPAYFYREILAGMATGFKHGDSMFTVFPCALQADTVDPGNNKDNATGNYIGTRVNSTIALLLDGLNIHAYSWIGSDAGPDIGVFPEYLLSTQQSVKNMLRWRNANMPGKPVYITEWGWDSDGVGENCVGDQYHSVCVSAYEQGIYAVRGAMYLARLGLERLVWYFFANGDNCNTLFCRSGLTGSDLTKFAPKNSFRAFQQLLVLFGDKNFIGVVTEDINSIYAYSFGSSTTSISHVVFWRPINGTDTSTLPATIASLPYVPVNSYLLDGLSPQPTSTPNPTVDSKSNWMVKAVATPTVVVVKST